MQWSLLTATGSLPALVSLAKADVSEAYARLTTQGKSKAVACAADKAPEAEARPAYETKLSGTWIKVGGCAPCSPTPTPRHTVMHTLRPCEGMPPPIMQGEPPHHPHIRQGHA